MPLEVAVDLTPRYRHAVYYDLFAGSAQHPGGTEGVLAGNIFPPLPISELLLVHSYSGWLHVDIRALDKGKKRGTREAEEEPTLLRTHDQIACA